MPNLCLKPGHWQGSDYVVKRDDDKGLKSRQHNHIDMDRIVKPFSAVYRVQHFAGIRHGQAQSMISKKWVAVDHLQAYVLFE